MVAASAIVTHQHRSVFGLSKANSQSFKQRKSGYSGRWQIFRLPFFIFIIIIITSMRWSDSAAEAVWEVYPRWFHADDILTIAASESMVPAELRRIG